MSSARPRIRLNPTRMTHLSEFCAPRPNSQTGDRSVYFIRWTGCPDSPEQIVRQASALAAAPGCLCLGSLDAKLLPADAAVYRTCCDQLLQGIPPSHLPIPFSDPGLSGAFAAVFPEAVSRYGQSHAHATETIRRNFGIKLLHWTARCLPRLYPQGAPGRQTPKVLWLGAPGISEYLFLYVLTQLGCDAAILSPEGELSLPQPLRGLSAPAPGSPAHGLTFAADCFTDFQAPLPQLQPQSAPAAPASAKPVLKLPPHPRRQARSQPTPAPAARPVLDVCAAATLLSYEALAGLAASVVMIEVLNSSGECFATGSGILIAPGIVLTNFHVVQGGYSYCVHLENDPTAYRTDELLKYHNTHDLALLRIACTGQPIPLYCGGPLARGQEVVAIGSPLGLFNSVSDGIISGFRQIEEKSMIQFTAPTSPGSSGGALLNRYGQLIGVITGAFRDGQNLNLAVDYQTVRPFVQGFI